MRPRFARIAVRIVPRVQVREGMAVPQLAPRLRWGLVGGGEDSQIGGTHRIGAWVDGAFELVAGALDVDPARGRAYAQRLGVAPERAYGTWQEMLAGERDRDDRPDLVTVATPNRSHFEIAKAFLEAGCHVLCEKPLTTTVEDGEALVAVAREAGRILAVNYGYSGYPLVRHMRAMVARGDLGTVRLVFAEFAHGFYAGADDQDNPRVRWRFDPAQAGASAVYADQGIHAQHLACFVTGQSIRSVTADFASMVAGRRLEDDAMVSFRMSGGAVARLWATGLAIGRMHGLTLAVYGEKGGLDWAQEQPNQLRWTPLDEPTRTLERGAQGLSASADRASRVTIGHPEGMPLAFANIYADLAEAIRARQDGRAPDPLALDYPSGEDGVHSLRVIRAAVESAGAGGARVDV